MEPRHETPQPLHHPGPTPAGGRDNGQLVRALLLLVLVVLGGTIGFARIEHWSAWDSFYFTLTTITTVGYGDQGISEPGRKFATVLMLGGVISASYAFAVVIETSLAKTLAWKKRMTKRIDRIREHAIVCGFGRMGRAVCKGLNSKGIPFVVIERGPQAFGQALDLGYAAVQGCASEDSILIEAGVERAAFVITAIDSLAENIVIAMSAKDAHPDLTVVARAESERDVLKLKRAGADRIISPYKSGGDDVVGYVVNPTVAEFLANAHLGEADVALAEVKVHAESALEGVKLADYGRSAGKHISFVALQRGHHPNKVPPGGEERLQAEDRLIVAGDPAEVAEMRERARVARLRSA